MRYLKAGAVVGVEVGGGAGEGEGEGELARAGAYKKPGGMLTLPWLTCLGWDMSSADF